MVYLFNGPKTDYDRRLNVFHSFFLCFFLYLKWLKRLWIFSHFGILFELFSASKQCVLNRHTRSNQQIISQMVTDLETEDPMNRCLINTISHHCDWPIENHFFYIYIRFSQMHEMLAVIIHNSNQLFISFSIALYALC